MWKVFTILPTNTHDRLKKRVKKSCLIYSIIIRNTMKQQYFKSVHAIPTNTYNVNVNATNTIFLEENLIFELSYLKICLHIEYAELSKY